jgi:hypothetical protein
VFIPTPRITGDGVLKEFGFNIEGGMVDMVMLAGEGERGRGVGHGDAGR